MRENGFIRADHNEPRCAAARRLASLQAELPELWPTEASMDEAAALRAQVCRLQARLAENSPERPVPAARGLPTSPVERGAIPQPEPVDCADGEAPARFGLRRGPLRRGRQPKRPRKAVTTLFPRLRGGMEVEDGELLTGLRSLRGALARGLVPQVDRPGVRRPVMMSGPPSTEGTGLLLEMWRPGMLDLREGRLGMPPSLRLRYRGTAIHLPLTWLTGYLGEYIATRRAVPPSSSTGVVSGRGDVMDVFWPRFRARARGLRPRRSAYGHLIGCWMLPTEGDPNMPTSLFFQGGGEQRMVHELSCQMLEAYLDFATVPRRVETSGFFPRIKVVSDGGWCDGLAGFIGAMLLRDPAYTLRLGSASPEQRGGEPCADARLHYVSSVADARLDAEWTPPCAGLDGDFEGESHLCSVIASATTNSLRDASLPAWDDYGLELRRLRYLRRDGSYVWFAAEDSPRSDFAPWPSGDARVVAAQAGGYPSIMLPAAHLAFDAELAEPLMFMAQVCLDYCWHIIRVPGEGTADRALEVLEAGRRFAGYALSLIAERASLLVHELGHMYLGGVPHCGFDTDGSGAPRWRSCFDVARRHLWAQVVAENGLAVHTYTARTDGPLGGDPDFDFPPAEIGFALANDIWRFGTGSSCERLVRGDERPSSKPEWRDVNRSHSGCIGQVLVVLPAVGELGGGYQMTVTDGCQCSASSIEVEGSRFERALVRSSPCLDSFTDAVGTYYVSTT